MHEPFLNCEGHSLDTNPLQYATPISVVNTDHSGVMTFIHLSHSDKATNPDHSEPDWETILEIVEEVKTKGVT